MPDATATLRELARRIVDAALELGPLRAALVAGSAARDDADSYSDLDLLLFVDELPPAERLPELQAALDGTSPVRFGERTETWDALQFDVDGISAQVVYETVEASEAQLERLLASHEDAFGPAQKIAGGFLEALPLHGHDLVERWRAQVAAYPEPLRLAMIERHWSFFPLWYYGDALDGRDAELWRFDMLVEAAFNLLAVLSALNRLYFARFQLKRMRKLVDAMSLAPPRLADRLEQLFQLPAREAADELGRLVVETRELVHAELPDLELPLRRPPGTAVRPWGR
jgi:predicted nucleotidyltransferase